MTSTEPASFDEELTRVGVQINHLLVVQAGLLCRRNQHYSPIYTLPPELLTTAFLLSCTSGRTSWDEFGTPTRQILVLSSVSSYWRQLVLDTPSLWSTVALVVEGCTSGTKAALLQHHLIHAKNRDVSLDFLLASHGKMTDAQQQQILNILFAPENAQKITILRVRNLPARWLAMFSQFPRLHTLVLDNFQNEDYDLVFENIRNVDFILGTLDFRTQPLLRLSLSFDGEQVPWGPTNLPSSVKELLTNSVVNSLLLEILRQCPNLTKFIGSAPLDDLDSSFLTTPLTLGRLGTLIWSAESLDLTSAQNLSLPVLKHLRLEKGSFRSPMPVIIFCHQLSKTLTSLELHQFDYWMVVDFQRLFFHKLECLEMLKLTEWPLSGLVMATRALTPSAEEFRHNELPTLPRLQTLVLETCDPNASNSYWANTFDVLPKYSKLNYSNDRTRTDDMISLFLDLLKKRRAGETTLFCLDLPEFWFGKQELNSSDKRRGMFRHAIAARRIEVLQDGKVLKL